MPPAAFDRARKFGIEIEAYNVAYATLERELNTAFEAAGLARRAAVEGYNHNRSRNWKITSDASLGGLPHSFELVSPPLKGEDGLAELKLVCEVLNRLGAKVSRACGLHVHHDASGLTVERAKALLTLWWKYEDVLVYFVSPSRRANYFARPAMPRDGWHGYRYAPRRGDDPVALWRTALATVTALGEFDEGGFQPDRYATVNLHAYWRHGTVEFRAHQGTVDYAKIEAWIALTQSLMTRAFSATVRVGPRLTGRWAENTAHFFRALEWTGSADPVIQRSEIFLRGRFEHFKRADADEAERGSLPPPPRRAVQQAPDLEAANAALREQAQATANPTIAEMRERVSGVAQVRADVRTAIAEVAAERRGAPAAQTETPRTPTRCTHEQCAPDCRYPSGHRRARELRARGVCTSCSWGTHARCVRPCTCTFRSHTVPF